MLNERELRVLARIERHLIETDPDLVRLFRGGAPRSTGAGPRSLLVAGLLLVVLGSVMAVVPVALTGVGLAMVALWGAFLTSGGVPRPGFA